MGKRLQAVKAARKQKVKKEAEEEVKGVVKETIKVAFKKPLEAKPKPLKVVKKLPLVDNCSPDACAQGYHDEWFKRPANTEMSRSERRNVGVIFHNHG